MTGQETLEELRRETGFNGMVPVTGANDAEGTTLTRYITRLEDELCRALDFPETPEAPPGQLVIAVDLGSLIVDEGGAPRFLPDVILERAAARLAESAGRSLEELVRQEVATAIAKTNQEGRT